MGKTFKDGKFKKDYRNHKADKHVKIHAKKRNKKVDIEKEKDDEY